MKTNVYIDGFNFYYACFKNWDDPTCHEFKANGPFKWVDLRALSQRLFPNDTIHRIQYCTAMVKGNPGDPNKPARQELYLRALRTTGMLHVRLGHFEERRKRGRVVAPLPCRVNPPCVTGLGLMDVAVREEKGSDVNLATYLLKDAFLGDFEQAVVISNDSDLASAIHVARVDAKRPVHVVSPSLSVVRELRTAATAARLLDKSLIPSCQLPTRITLPNGTVITKPTAW
jgi:hypothetical protein